MTDATGGLGLADQYRKATVEADHGKSVMVEEYPGGDMTIYTRRSHLLYLTSDEASALRSALGKIDGSKRHADADQEDEGHD